jgi:hypothetical protein
MNHAKMKRTNIISKTKTLLKSKAITKIIKTSNLKDLLVLVYITDLREGPRIKAFSIKRMIMLKILMITVITKT